MNKKKQYSTGLTKAYLISMVICVFLLIVAPLVVAILLTVFGIKNSDGFRAIFLLYWLIPLFCISFFVFLRLFLRRIFDIDFGQEVSKIIPKKSEDEIGEFSKKWRAFKKYFIYWLLIVISFLFLLGAVVLLLIGLLSKSSEEEKLSNYLIALIGFLGSVGGFALPLTIGRYVDFKREIKDLKSLLDSVYSEIADFYKNLLKFEFFAFETPCWETFKTEYTHYYSINKNVADHLSNVYRNINYYLALQNEYRISKKEDSIDQAQILTKITVTREKLLVRLENFIHPEKLYISCGSDYFSTNVQFFSEAPQTGVAIKLLFTDKTFLKLSDARKEECINRILADKFLTNRVKGVLRAKTISKENGSIYNILIYKTPVYIEDYVFYSEDIETDQIPNFKDYYSLLPTLLLKENISPANIKYMSYSLNFTGLVDLFSTNYMNENFTNYLLSILDKENTVGSFLDALLNSKKHSSDELIVVSFIQAAINYHISIGFKKKIVNNRVIDPFVVSISDSMSEKARRFVYCINKIVDGFKEGYFEDFEMEKDDLVGLLLEDLKFISPYDKKSLKSYDDLQKIAKIEIHLRHIRVLYYEYSKNLVNNYGEVMGKKILSCVFGNFLNRVPYLQSQLMILDETTKDYKTERSMYYSVKEISDLILFETNDVWDYRKYSNFITAVPFIFKANRSIDDIKATGFESLIDKFVDIAKKNKGTIIEEIYFSLFFTYLCIGYHILTEKLVKCTDSNQVFDLEKIADWLTTKYVSVLDTHLISICSEEFSNAKTSTDELVLSHNKLKVEKKTFYRNLQKILD